MSESPVNPYAPTALALEAPDRLRRWQLTRRMRFTLFVHGVILPAILFWMSYSGQPVTSDSPWQSGKWEHYVVMLLKPVAWLPFVPAILFCVISMSTWTIAPSSSQKTWVRMGIYTGVPLALHFWVVLLLLYAGPMLILTALALPCWHVGLWILNYFWRRQFHLWQIMAVMTLCALLLALDGRIAFAILYIPVTAFWFLLVAAPGLNFVAYCVAAYFVSGVETAVSRGTRRGMIGAFVVWFAAWLLGWRFAVVAMLDEYAKLPTFNPNCYLSNAAAYAHRSLTGVTSPGQITPCMRRLKFLELAFKALAPALHRFVRAYYDHYCPPLARKCQRNIYLATATCIGLWPVELLAGLLRRVLRISRKRVDRIYSGKSFAEMRLLSEHRLMAPVSEQSPKF